MAVGSYTISQSAIGTSQKNFFKTLRQIGSPALYIHSKSRSPTFFPSLLSGRFPVPSRRPLPESTLWRHHLCPLLLRSQLRGFQGPHPPSGRRKSRRRPARMHQTNSDAAKIILRIEHVWNRGEPIPGVGVAWSGLFGKICRNLSHNFLESTHFYFYLLIVEPTTESELLELQNLPKSESQISGICSPLVWINCRLIHSVRQTVLQIYLSESSAL